MQQMPQAKNKQTSRPQQLYRKGFAKSCDG